MKLGYSSWSIALALGIAVGALLGDLLLGIIIGVLLAAVFASSAALRRMDNTPHEDEHDGYRDDQS